MSSVHTESGPSVSPFRICSGGTQGNGVGTWGTSQIPEPSRGPSPTPHSRPPKGLRPLSTPKSFSGPPTLRPPARHRRSTSVPSPLLGPDLSHSVSGRHDPGLGPCHRTRPPSGPTPGRPSRVRLCDRTVPGGTWTEWRHYPRDPVDSSLRSPVDTRRPNVFRTTVVRSSDVPPTSFLKVEESDVPDPQNPVHPSRSRRPNHGPG